MKKLILILLAVTVLACQDNENASEPVPCPVLEPLPESARIYLKQNDTHLIGFNNLYHPDSILIFNLNDTLQSYSNFDSTGLEFSFANAQTDTLYYIYLNANGTDTIMMHLEDDVLELPQECGGNIYFKKLNALFYNGQLLDNNGFDFIYMK